MTASTAVRLPFIVLVVYFATSALAQSEFSDAHDRLLRIRELRQSSASKERAMEMERSENLLPEQIESLLNQGVVSFLDSNPASASRLRQRLQDALQLDAKAEQLAFVMPIGTDAAQQFLIAYRMPYCASCARSWIGVAGPTQNGHFRISASVENPQPDQTLTIGATVCWQQGDLVGFQFQDSDPGRQVVKDWINSFLGLD